VVVLVGLGLRLRRDPVQQTLHALSRCRPLRAIDSTALYIRDNCQLLGRM
jgi:hypothetical protein